LRGRDAERFHQPGFALESRHSPAARRTSPAISSSREMRCSRDVDRFVVQRRDLCREPCTRLRAGAPVGECSSTMQGLTLGPAYTRERGREALAMRLDLGLLRVVVETVDHLAQIDVSAAQQVAEREQPTHSERRSHRGVEHALLAALDALRQFDFAFTREQRDLPHLAQIGAHRIVGASVFVVVDRTRLSNALDAALGVHDGDLASPKTAITSSSCSFVSMSGNASFSSA
jgi:hypothetical protein